MAKLRKIIQILLIINFILCSSTSFSQNIRSIDNEKHMKSLRQKRYRPSPEERLVMKIEKNKAKKDAKKKKRDARLHKKAVKKHNKLINGGGKDVVDGKRTYKRMKKSKKSAKYTRE
ncbi:MAG: hypothetical protein QM212_00740 [Bacteroidota bacterium]|jgi:predicted Holliday junction resolvase-like endonuclease|nr:hypothetical protein [Bacteroidales bacterium]MDI9534500.1 hypothetical protein [Bacteroidota bacterium]OQC46604.1 MAG: hypothetical protein BWX59_00297 [Bacteroidetes bacterium ADurb.Bin028]NLP19336.1 hypothetical protein [Bacteroidales bacterium]HNY43987.1 hypothetical protein [Bacteroidales bacterium]